MLVARSSDVAAAKLLLDQGANPNAKESQKGQTALMWAAAKSQGAMVRELLAHGAERQRPIRVRSHDAAQSAPNRAPSLAPRAA